MNPGFTLRGINYTEFMKRYRAGKLKIVPPKPLKLSGPVKLERVAGTSPADSYYEYRHNNQAYLVHTTNNSRETRCRNCKKVRDQDSQAQWCGIPYSMTHRRQGEEIVCTVLTDGSYCSESCMDRIYRLFKAPLPLFRNAKHNIEYLHKLAHGDAPLRSAPDPDLLEENGGSMTREEYHSNLTPWQLSANTLVIPTRLQYTHKRE